MSKKLKDDVIGFIIISGIGAAYGVMLGYFI